MLGAHKEEYKIDDKLYTASANFVSDRLEIYGQGGFRYSCSLDEYTDFEGNMKDFINSKVKEN